MHQLVAGGKVETRHVWRRAVPIPKAHDHHVKERAPYAVWERIYVGGSQWEPGSLQPIKGDARWVGLRQRLAHGGAHGREIQEGLAGCRVWILLRTGEGVDNLPDCGIRHGAH